MVSKSLIADVFEFLPFSIFLDRRRLLNAAVARTPLAGPFVKNEEMLAFVSGSTWAIREQWIFIKIKKIQ